MGKYIIIGFILMLVSCEHDNIVSTDGSQIWQPKPWAIINDSEVQINWLNSVIFNKVLLPYKIVNPDKFEIYISAVSANHFNKLIELDNDGEYTYSIANLENEKIYYLYVVSKKQGYNPLSSDTIMVIPNKKTQMENLVTSENPHTIASVSIAREINKIAYVDKYYSWNGGANCCMAVSVFISDIDGSANQLLDIYGYEPSWSPNNNKIVFRTENGETNTGNRMPSQIALYDFETKTISKLTNGNFYNYAPVFSKSGELILYQSNKNSPYPYSTNIWMMNLRTAENIWVTDIANSNLTNTGRPNWIDNEKFLFQGTGINNKSQIYESSILTKQMHKIINSDWNDYCPSISPDNKEIAFISDRSGNNQIWLFSFQNQTYRQLTGFSTDEYLNESWSRIEWMDTKTLLFTFADNRLIKQRIE